VESLDLEPLYRRIEAVVGKPGRDAVDPRILLALWLYATIDSVSSARELARLTERDLVYMWICGGVSVNYHLLSDFRTQHRELLEELLVTSVASLIHTGVVTLETVAQDGMRVRANAGSSSFRRKASLERCLETAKARVKSVLEAEEAGVTPQQASARERAANEQLQRVEEALKQVLELEAEKEKRKKGTGEQARCSTTDPDSRKMKMGDGGYRPAYNVQLATDGASRVIVGVTVTNAGNDGEQMGPMQAGLREKYDKAPEHYLVDCGFSNVQQVTVVERNGSRVYAPVHGEAGMQARGKDPYARQRRDTDESFRFRQRMASDEAKTRYQQRASIAEYVNAEFRNRGLTQFRVRGLEKVRVVAIWHALAHNLLRIIHLGAMA
jgi:transposase